MKRQNFIIGLLLLVGITLYIVLYFKWRHLSSLEYAAQSITEIYHERAAAASIIAEQTLAFLKKNPEEPAALFKNSALLSEKTNFSIRLYDKEKLVFWNDLLPIPKYRNDLINGVQQEPFTENWLYLYHVKEQNFTVLVADPIFEVHSFNNRYIRSGFSNAYGRFRNNFVLTSPEEGEMIIHGQDGKTVFGIRTAENYRQESERNFILWNSLFILLNLSLIYILLYHLLKRNYSNSPGKLLGIFAAFVCCCLILLLFFEPLLNQHSNTISFNELLEQLAEVHFISGGIGLFFIHGVLAFCLTLYYTVKQISEKGIPRNHSILEMALIYLGIVFVSLVQYILIKESVGLTSGSLQITRINEFGWEELLAVFYIIGFSLAAIFLLATLFEITLQTRISKKQQALLLGAIITPILIVYIAGNVEIRFFASYVFLLLLLTLSSAFSKHELSTKRKLFILGLIILISGQITYLLYRDTVFKTNQNLEFTARQLSFEKDPLFEFLWRSSYSQITEDKYLNELLITDQPNDDTELELKIARYLEKKYFPDYFKKFEIWISLCRPESRLFIPSQSDTIECQTYFKTLVEQYGHAAESPGLYLLEDPRQGLYYLADVPLKIQHGPDKKVPSHLFIEFYQKLVPKGLGYLELLTDQYSGLPKDVTGYSIAIYQNDELLYKVGKRLFPASYHAFNPEDKILFNTKFNQNYVHKVNDQRMIVVSQRRPGWSVTMAPFSFFFLILILPLLTQLIGWKIFAFSYGHTFRFRLQLLLLGSLLLSILILGAGSIYYITNIYEKKNDSFLFEKTQSILNELENKLVNDDFSNPENIAFLQERLAKLSLVFFSDINVYNVDGQLITSSRNDIYDHYLLAPQMQPEAYYNMKFGQNLYFKQNENISGFDFLSSYAPLTQQSGKVVAFVNLPFFARETEMQNELLSLILTYTNFLIFIASLAIFLVLMLSQPLLEPLQLIQDKMRGIRIGYTNEKINWARRDEIGQLVREYNNLIDQLAESAEKLAKSERESAWREMARQIAHEIKNPLTPMRLSVQYLLKAWNDKDAQIDDKIKMTSQTIINQIDTLSSIATAFSDFARMPENNTDKVELISLLRELIVLFDNQQSIEFSLETGLLNEIYLAADRSGLHRVFTNLIKNSIQAIGERSDGKIEIVVESFMGFSKIIVRDNGKGMLPDEAKRVFSPNFTTKTSGMGIGLAMVYNLVKAFGGNIDFETEAGKGTTFIIQIPLYQDDVAKSY